MKLNDLKTLFKENGVSEIGWENSDLIKIVFSLLGGTEEHLFGRPRYFTMFKYIMESILKKSYFTDSNIEPVYMTFMPSIPYKIIFKELL